MITGETPINISTLNDFIFCPLSIYFHALEDSTERITYQDHYQIDGSAAHYSIDRGVYSDRKIILQGIPVYSEKYDLYGKIDIFDIKTGKLTERKKKIKVIYDGYIFQLYAQYFSLSEMGYTVKTLAFHSMDDNKTYYIPLPSDNEEMLHKFEDIIIQIKHFSANEFQQDSIQKCLNCIYEPLCSFSVTSEDML